MRVALATCLEKPEPDPDEEPLLDALRERDLTAEAVAWDAPSDWRAWDLVVLRSTWNYAEQPTRFRAWLTEVAQSTRLLNPAAVAHDNLDKRYLLGLAERGVPVVPTDVIEQGPCNLNARLEARGFRDVVIKPVIGAASFCTQHFADGFDPRAQSFLDTCLAERAMMVQPYQRAVEGSGEHAIVWIDGAPSHAIRKTPRFQGEDEHVSEALPIDDAQRRLAETALAPWPDLLYARVDVVAGDDGALRVMELELVEPSLFLIQHPPALNRLANAIAARALDRRSAR